MRVIVAIIFWTICLMVPSNVPVAAVVVIPPMPQVSPAEAIALETECDCVTCNAYDDAWCEFTNLFNSYTYKVSKNGRSMVNGKFVKKG
jgi:hypothetical protein